MPVFWQSWRWPWCPWLWRRSWPKSTPFSSFRASAVSASQALWVDLPLKAFKKTWNWRNFWDGCFDASVDVLILKSVTTKHKDSFFWASHGTQPCISISDIIILAIRRSWVRNRHARTTNVSFTTGTHRRQLKDYRPCFWFCARSFFLLLHWWTPGYALPRKTRVGTWKSKGMTAWSTEAPPDRALMAHGMIMKNSE